MLDGRAVIPEHDGGKRTCLVYTIFDGMKLQERGKDITLHIGQWLMHAYIVLLCLATEASCNGTKRK
jgi:hypothetical protein